MQSTNTKLRHAMRLLRGKYMKGVRAGRVELDKDVLREFDDMMEKLNERPTDGVPAKHS